MGEVRPVYGFWNQNAAHGCSQCLLGAKTSLMHQKIPVVTLTRGLNF